jgi:hypothetical protein
VVHMAGCPVDQHPVHDHHGNRVPLWAGVEAGRAAQSGSPARYSMSAFWTCMRFPASSHDC